MTAEILDGKTMAGRIQDEIRDEVAQFVQHTGCVPCLAAVLVGDDPASQVYVRNKQRACERVGVESRLHRLPDSTSTDALLALVTRLNEDPSVHGILVQTPLPAAIDPHRIVMAVSPAKDVDAFHPENVGLLVQGRPRFLPCTPHGIQQLLIRSGIAIGGKHVVVVGRSDIVGKPMALLLVQRNEHANATVTICHSHTQDLASMTRLADILIVAVGRPRLVDASMVKPGAVVVDVGIHRTEAGLVGDVDFEGVRRVAAHITPVPGGVGPLTVTMLLFNTLAAARALAN